MADELIRNVDIKHYFPNVIAPSLEFQELAKTEDIEFSKIWPQARKWFVNTYVHLLDVDGAKRWESMLGLRPDDTDTLEQRKSAILAKINHSLPYTERKFQLMLDQQFGEGLVTSKVDYNAYKLNLEIYDDAGINERNVYKYARIIVPANLGIVLNLIVVLYVKSRHFLSTHIAWAGIQRYFSDNTGKTQALYWEGTHNRNGILHTHYFDGTYRHDALEGDNSYKDDQKHFLAVIYQGEAHLKTEIKHSIQNARVAEITQANNGGKKQNMLDGNWRLDGSHTLSSDVFYKGMYEHLVKVTSIRKGVETEELL